MLVLVMESFARRFEKYLTDNPEAGRLVDSIVKRGCDRAFLIRALGEVTNPGVGKKLRRVGKKVVDSVLTRKKVLGLSGRLTKLGNDLEKDLSHPVLGGLPEVGRLLTFARQLKREAATLNGLPLPRLGKVFSYKAFWSHLPTVGLCMVLNAPKVVTYQEISHLLWYAEDTQGREWKLTYRGIEREHKRFLKSPQYEFFAHLVALKRGPPVHDGNEVAHKTFPVR